MSCVDDSLQLMLCEDQIDRRTLIKKSAGSDTFTSGFHRAVPRMGYGVQHLHGSDTRSQHEHVSECEITMHHVKNQLEMTWCT